MADECVAEVSKACTPDQHAARYRVVSFQRLFTLERVEITVAILLTCLAIYIQFHFYLNAGGLWRDETNSINLATTPHVGDIWNHLDGDSFPLLWFYVLRAWAWLGLGGSDMGIRLLSLLIAVGIYGVIWLFTARLGVKRPLLSILLLGLTPVFVRTIGSNRAYGLGILLVLSAWLYVWQLVSRPRNSNFVLACLLAILAVQTVYYNILFVTAAVVAGVIISVRNRWRGRCGALLAIETFCIVSLAPYIMTVQKQHDWSALVSTRLTLANVWDGLYQALGTPTQFMAWLWIELFALCILAVIMRQVYRLRTSDVQQDPDPITFAGISALLGMASLFSFLLVLRYIVRPWYFVGLIPALGLCIDVVVHQYSQKSTLVRIGRLAVVVAAGAIVMFPAKSAIDARQTNLDIVSDGLLDHVTSKDYILVNPWFYGVSFDRYYRGRAPWNTVPPVRFIKYDFVRVIAEQMVAERPLDTELDRIVSTCRSGGRVYVVGDPTLMIPGQQLMPKPIKRRVGNWQLLEFLMGWSARVRHTLFQHARMTAKYHLTGGRAVNPEEDATVEIWEPRLSSEAAPP